MYPEPHVPADHEARRLFFIAGLIFCAAFWTAVMVLAIDAAMTRPAACDGLTAAECGEQVAR